jgi:hypothetical protein
MWIERSGADHDLPDNDGQQSSPRPSLRIWAQARAAAERAIVRYQQPPAKFSAASARKKAAHPWALYETQMMPAAAWTLPPAKHANPKARARRYTGGAIRRRMPDRGGDAHHVRRRFGRVVLLGAFIGMPPRDVFDKVIAN